MKLQKLAKKRATRNSKGTAIHTESNETSTTVEQRQAEHITLKKLHSAKNILHTLDLLERLFKARGGNKDIAHKLAKLRTVWGRVRQECKNANAAETTTNFNAQWAGVIFGSTSLTLEPGKQKTQELLERRIVWDSYTSYGKGSSCIPSGWVLPPEHCTAEWMKFKCK
ncbi:GH18654 [Drosophila grimshawi]|uniref:GH18654 n=2 Tax=Drosophila grimshawi TaxID=7222 RepID=B4JH65_DROGR|nr:GH18654 [Drosophila grimshawi]